MPQRTFPKAHRLLTRKEFVDLSIRGRNYSGRVIFIQWKKSSHSVLRLGITVTKKFGKAHDRNRFKRLVREAFRALLVQYPDLGVEFNVKPRIKTHDFTVEAIQNDLQYFFDSFKKISAPVEKQ